MRKIFVLLPLLVTASLANAQELTADQLVDKSIAHAGGWDAWMKTRSIQFRKTIVRYEPDGKVKETRVQYHKYLLHPSPMMRIDWEMNGSKGIMINDGRTAKKYANGKEMTAQEEINSARGNTFGSHYVFCMPFKLNDDGTHLENAGITTLADGTVVQKVRTTYVQGAGDAGGMHTWTYMFDPQTGRLAANHLEYAPGKFDWTEYFDEKPVGAMLLSTKRVGYGADANGKVGPKRSDTTYDEIKIDVDFPKDTFEFLK
ncbi:MAG: hypothetical protein M3Q46_09815 [Verrucomicrobiota bacterium]|nr:hypothetical protein [Verrucomicrobiota bacterium]